jgi:hypothetical protein
MLAALAGATGTLATTANISSSLFQTALLGRGGKQRIDRTAALLFLAPAEHHVTGEVLYGWMTDVASIGRDDLLYRNNEQSPEFILICVDSVVIEC